MHYKLYGDGIHDDTLAIQELIDSTKGILTLPQPEECYLISKPLELPGNFKLVLPRFAEVKLMPKSDCYMLTNKESEICLKNIEIEGGIWNYNNLEQSPNPWLGLEEKSENPDYNGFAIFFKNIKGLRINSLTMKDVITFAITLDTVSYFTVDNIVFDFNYGNPLATNMDGVHLNGNCHYGHITNLQGACYDDLVAINADEGSGGPITNVTVDGIYAEDCHSAVRLYSGSDKYPVKNIHITNVYGTYFQYCIGITRCPFTGGVGCFDGITLDNIYASKAVRLPVYNKPEDSYVYPLIFIDDELYIKALKIADLHRVEYVIPIDTILVRENTVIEQMILENITTENHTGEPMRFFRNCGTINHLHTNALYEDNEPVTISI
ncbi:MAG: hypothetical protein IKC46_14370 [Lachnospiraceae bacterium]|nr:hypothetical protein [Lachnospiraceae bacterium]